MKIAILHFPILIRVRDWGTVTDSGDCRYNGRMWIRLRNACALVIALLVLAASSQSVVCESACSSASQRSCCQGASGTDAMLMSGDHCTGDMSSMPGATASDGNHCDHVAIVATEASAFGLAGFNGVRWATRVALHSARSRGVNRPIVKAPPLRRTVADLRSVSLRV
jgi:hypothetical protein